MENREKVESTIEIRDKDKLGSRITNGDHDILLGTREENQFGSESNVRPSGRKTMGVRE